MNSFGAEPHWRESIVDASALRCLHPVTSAVQNILAPCRRRKRRASRTGNDRLRAKLIELSNSYLTIEDNSFHLPFSMHFGSSKRCFRDCWSTLSGLGNLLELIISNSVPRMPIWTFASGTTPSRTTCQTGPSISPFATSAT
jgi:hypothetical protein